MPSDPEFEVIGDLSDAAVEALAQLLLSIPEQEEERQQEVQQEPHTAWKAGDARSTKVLQGTDFGFAEEELT